MKLEDISDVLGISVSSVSRMVKKGLEKMEKRAKKLGYEVDIGDFQG
jgi:DNA-directed RNA polymerase specialized sigma subunit